ncbi:cyclin-like protein [Chytriomyces sp. MP71]|nr:cyclin-like protein [Chytriomyces sp. MP71]
MLLSEYAEEIFEHMKLMETKTTPNPDYMTHQPHLTWEMRSLLVDWLQSLHTRLHLLPETLFLAVNLMDRFMSLKLGVGRDKFQLVGLTCLQVACKYEEVMVPSVAVLVHMVQGGYSADEVLKAERFVLGMIGFGIGYNGPVPFLKRVLAVDARGTGEGFDASGEVAKVSLLARYFCEVVLLDPGFVGAAPSMVATAAVFLGRKMLEVGPWTPQHEKASGFSEERLFKYAKAMYSSVGQVTVEAAVYVKYSNSKFSHVAAFVTNFVASNVVNT